MVLASAGTSRGKLQGKVSDALAKVNGNSKNQQNINSITGGATKPNVAEATGGGSSTGSSIKPGSSAGATGSGGKNKPVIEEPTVLPNYQNDLKGHQASIPKIEGVPGANQPAIKPETPFPTNTAPNKNSVGTLTGERATAKPNSNSNWESNRGMIRENDSADVLVQNGYNVHQNPKVINLSEPVKNKPDFIINGYVFDNYAPQGGTAVKDIRDTIAGKVGNAQAPRIVLNLMDDHIPRNELRNYLNQNPIQGLQEIIVIDQNKNVIRFYP